MIKLEPAVEPCTDSVGWRLCGNLKKVSFDMKIFSDMTTYDVKEFSDQLTFVIV